MVLLEKLWDDVVAGPQPDKGLGKLRKLSTKSLSVKGDDHRRRLFGPAVECSAV